MVQKKDCVVVTGVSCRLPESNNIQEFAEHLYNGDDLVTEDSRRWEPGYYGLPKRHAKLKEVSKFDASFFGVSPKQANAMDPQLRILLEVSYEAILDAGLDPQSLRGSRTGVFVGTSSSETQDTLTHDPDQIMGYSLTGCQHSMFANRLSFTFDFQGPSFAVDTACSSSMLAFQLAVDHIKHGLCDAALVCGTHLTLKPTSAMQFNKLSMLSPQGKCQSFDANGDGYVRAEGVVAVLLQKDDDARRIYAEIVHAKSNTDGHKEQGITYPSGAQQAALLRQVYDECGVDPADVTYVECHGTGTKVGDPQETNAIAEVFCQNRQSPLLIGSVKSNMGHAEPTSGLASIAKVLIAISNGMIPANLHFRTPNPNIPALIDGRLKVVTEATPIDDVYIGINSFGFGGANTHVVFRSRGRLLEPPAMGTAHAIPRLLTYCGRTQNSVSKTLQYAKQHAQSDYLHAMLSEQCIQMPSQQPFRGFTIFDEESAMAVETFNDVQRVAITDKRRPIWFIYSGMGTHYVGMGKALMGIEVFAKTIKACTKVLTPFNVDVYDLIVNGGSEGHWCAVCICAIQIALTETLKHLGIVPDGIMGHSFGEMAAGYGDGALSLEEAMLCAYYRTKAIIETVTLFQPGAMAAVGLTWEEAKQRCPEGVVPACHNAKDSVTISGEATKVESFAKQLQEEGIFAKVVNSAGVAFHSPQMSVVAKPMKAALEKILGTPKKRSPRWISTSVPESKWNTPLGQYCSPDYHVNNALSPVLFYEALQHVPEQAVLIEIAPHCLLQAILRRATSPSCTSVGLLKANHENNLNFFLQALGKIYQSGLSIRVDRLYPTVRYPAPCSTPFLSPAIEWDHSQDWRVITQNDTITSSVGNAKPVSCSYTIDPYGKESEDRYLIDHVIDGKPLFPFAGHVVLAWRTLAKLKGLDFEKTRVQLDDINVYRATILSETPVKLDVIVSSGGNTFEILEGDTLAASGKITVIDQIDRKRVGRKTPIDSQTSSSDMLTGNDVYKELRLRGYEYGQHFRPIIAASLDGVETDLMWTGNNWIPFIDSLLQSMILLERGDTLKLPVRIQQIIIDPIAHVETVVQTKDGQKLVPATNNKRSNRIVAGGITLSNLVAQSVARRGQLPPGAKLVVEKSIFVPHQQNDCLQSSPERQSLISYQQTVRRRTLSTLKRLHDLGLPLPQGGLMKGLLTAQATTANVSETMDDNRLSEEESSVILRLLNQLRGVDTTAPGGKKLLMTTIEQGIQRVDDDRLWNAAFRHDAVLKPMLDLVLENVPGQFLRFGSLENTSVKAVEACRNVQSNEPLLQTETTLINPLIELNDEEQRQHNLAIRQVDLNQPIDAASERYHCLVLDRVLHRKEDIGAYLTAIRGLLTDDGFLLVNEVTGAEEVALAVSALRGDPLPTFQSGRNLGVYMSHRDWLQTFDRAGMQTVASRSDSALPTSLYLLKVKPNQTEVNRKVVSVDDYEQFGWVDTLRQSLDASSGVPDAKVWLTASRPNNGLVGFGLCLKAETSDQRIRTLVNGNVDNSTLDVERCMATALKSDLHSNVIRDGVCGSFRHLPIKEDEILTYERTEHAFINALVTGDLNSLRWVQSPNRYWRSYSKENANLSLCSVYYSSLNFRDVMLASGRLSPDAIPGKFTDRDCLLGMEFAGRDQQGRRLMGLLPAQALATTVLADKRFVWDVPERWTMAEAATVPVAYTTAYYALVVRGRVKSGDKVLIHAGSGGVGQAAIAVALSIGCEVYTTISNDEKKRFLQDRFNLPDDRFANSRSTDFEQYLLDITDGYGMDVVLNSLSEDKLQASVRCLAVHGRFLEIGKFDLSNNSSLGMAVFLKNASFHGILLDSLFDDGNTEWMQVARLLSDGIAAKVVTPLPTTVFESERVTEAFRFMAQGKHIGKVLLKIKPEEAAGQPVSSAVTVNAVRRTLCHPEHVYVITGGLGGFGLELAQWLIKRGARKLVLTSRTGVRTGYQRRCLNSWQREGITVHISTVDTSTEEGAKSLVEQSIRHFQSPIGGLFHLAMVLRDKLFDDQTAKDFCESAESKYWGTKYLDQATRQLCNDGNLKWFVAFSSISCGRGNAGQTNYGWTNSAMERLMETRRRHGHPALAVQWGAIGDVGVVLETMMGDNRTVIGGTLPQRIPSCVQVLDSLLQLDHVVVSSYVRAPIAGRGGDSQLTGDVVEVVGQILGVADASQLNPDAPLGDLGLDSLMGVEIRQALERQFQISVTMKDIRTLTLNKLRQLANKDSGKTTAATANSEIQPPSKISATAAETEPERSRNTA